ncbi:MAG TPA: protein kinase [Terriglobales bacterium]
MSTASKVSAGLIGQQLGHYTILELVGTGGMGNVYRAHDQHLDRDVAVKVIPAGVLADPAARHRLRNEALMLSRLNHPNIATVHDFDTENGIDFLVTEFIAGDPLSDKIKQGPFPENEILEIGVQIAEGLAAAHEQGLLHRDLKPANVKIVSGSHVKILDFGLAVDVPQAGAATTSTAEVEPALAGTLPYMAPELLQGLAADVRSDIYSAGVLLYEIATGHLPFQQTIAPALVDSILHQVPPSPGLWNARLSSKVEELMMRCMAKNPAHRYQSARDLAADIRRMQIVGTGLEKSIAVLSFENLSSNLEQQYFRDGITEDITTELSKIKEFRVFSRSAVIAFRDKPVTPTYVGQQLNASNVVEGSVRREGDHLRITAKLVETKTGHTVWAEKYDRQLQDVFAIQDEVAKSIASALRVALSERERRDIEKMPTRDVRAYDFYLRGRQFFHEFREKGYGLAREMFEKAIELDPGYARAYAGIADCSAFLYIYWKSSQENVEKADSASRKALELDPDLAETHASRGLTFSLRKQYDEAEREFQLALRLNPRLFEAYYFNARNLFSQGRLEQAAEWFEQASRVVPEDYQSPMLRASVLNGLGRKEEALASYQRGLLMAEKHLETHPGDARALYFGANALTQLNEKERAIKWAERAVELEPDEHQVLYNVACVYALLGEQDRAIDCLQRSITQGWGQKEWMMNDPDLASLRGNPRFQRLIEQ